jgi:4-amino-4-deoxy-L-arabinose transferase-like glycosyltransferase
MVAVIRPPNRPAALITAYLFGFTHILAALLIAAAFGKLSSPYVVMLAQLVMDAGAYAIWLRTGKPGLLNWVKPLFEELKNGWKKALLRWPELCLLGAGLAAALTLSAILIWVVPPNNNDSLSTHLSRIGYWLQHSSLLPWPIFNARTVYYPINAALQVFWTVLMWGTDRLAGFVQWFSGLASIVTVFGIARLLGWSRWQSAFAALIWGSFPIVLLQTSTTQLDLVAAAIFLPVIYFLILGFKSGRRSMFVLSGLSLALALGTKQTLFFLLPGLLLFLLLQWHYWKKNPRQLATWFGSAAILFVLLSSPIYIINTVYFGNPLGPPDVVESSTGRLSGREVLNSLAYNMPRLIYQSVDFSGLPESLANQGYQLRAEAGQALARWTGYSLEGRDVLALNHQFSYNTGATLSEDESWFGILGVLLLFPASVQQFIYSIRKKDRLRLGMILLAVSFLPVEAVLRPGWDPYQGRYFIAAGAVAAPFLAVLAQPRLWSKVLRWISVAAALLIISVTMQANPAKPLDNPKMNVFTATRLDMQSLQGGNQIYYLQMLNNSLPKDTVVGFYSKTYLWDYPLFGFRFTRQVIPIVDADKLGDMEWLKSQGIQYVLVNVMYDYPRQLAQGLVPVDFVWSEWILYGWKDSGS